MNGLTFDDQHSFGDFGLYMLSANRPIAPEPYLVTEEVAGMDGELDYSEANPDNETKYKPVVHEIEFKFREGSMSNVRGKAHQIAKWLLCGEKKLIYDDDPNVYYMARVTNKIDLENQLIKLRRFTVQFRCRPFAFSSVSTTANILQTSGTVTVNNPGKVIRPNITIDGFFNNVTLMANGSALKYSPIVRYDGYGPAWDVADVDVVGRTDEYIANWATYWYEKFQTTVIDVIKVRKSDNLVYANFLAYKDCNITYSINNGVVNASSDTGKGIYGCVTPTSSTGYDSSSNGAGSHSFSDDVIEIVEVERMIENLYPQLPSEPDYDYVFIYRDKKSLATVRAHFTKKPLFRTSTGLYSRSNVNLPDNDVVHYYITEGGQNWIFQYRHYDTSGGVNNVGTLISSNYNLLDFFTQEIVFSATDVYRNKMVIQGNGTMTREYEDGSKENILHRVYGDFLKLQPGQNTISVSGAVTNIDVTVDFEAEVY